MTTANGYARRIWAGTLKPRTLGDFHNPGTMTPKGRVRADMHACTTCKQPSAKCACCGAPTVYASPFTVTWKKARKPYPVQTHYFTYCERCYQTLMDVRQAASKEKSA